MHGAPIKVLHLLLCLALTASVVANASDKRRRIGCASLLLQDGAYANLSDHLVLNPSLQRVLLFQVDPDRPIVIKGGGDEDRQLVIEAIVEKFKRLNWSYLRFTDQGYDGPALSSIGAPPARTTYETFAKLSELYADPRRDSPPAIDLITLEQRLDLVMPTEVMSLASMNYLYASAHRLLETRDVAKPWIVIPFPDHLIEEEPTLARVLFLSAHVIDLDHAP